MNKQEYISYALKSIWNGVIIRNEPDYDFIFKEVERCYNHKWEINDTIRYCQYTSEVQPGLSEERMRKKRYIISSKYESNKLGRWPQNITRIFLTNIVFMV